MMYATIGNIAFSMAAFFVKVAYKHNDTISPFEVIYWKSISMMVMAYMIVRSYGVFVLDVPPKYRNIVVLRGLLGYFGV